MKGLQGVTLDNPSLGMSNEALHHLWNLPYEMPPIVIDKVTRLAINLYLGNPSDTTYETNCKAIQHFDSNTELLSYYKIKCLVANLTGIESVMHHMCINSCLAYTGPLWILMHVLYALSHTMISSALEQALGTIRFLTRNSTRS